MRIAYISGSYVPSRGADSVHVMNMCQALAELGHDVTLHARHGLEPAQDDFQFYGVNNCFSIEKHPRPQLRVWGALVNAWYSSRAVRRRPLPDLIYAREVYGLAGSIATRVPFIFESHWNPKHAAQRELEAWLFRRPGFRRVVFISDALRQIYKKLFPWLPAEQMVVAHDSANLPSPSPATLRRGSPRLQVGYVGGFLPGYGIDMLPRLAARHSELDFHVVGGRASEVAAWRQRTKNLTNLEFHGFIEPGALGEAYAKFDVVLAPYQLSTAHIEWISPMKLFEYMAQAKAIVCSDFPVLREILQDDRDALLVRPDDLDAWSGALSKLANPELRARLASSANQRLQQQFTWHRRAQSVLAAGVA